MTAPASYDPARVREAIQTALADPAQHSNPEVADWITQQVTDRLTRALESGDWSFGTAETIVMDTHDEADAPPGEEWTISPDETEAVVDRINERLFAATGRRLAKPVEGPQGNLPAGFTLAEASPGQWRLTVPVGDLVAFHLDATDQVALRRAAFDPFEVEVAGRSGLPGFLERPDRRGAEYIKPVTGPWETRRRKVGPGRAIARRLTAVFRKEATS